MKAIAIIHTMDDDHVTVANIQTAVDTIKLPANGQHVIKLKFNGRPIFTNYTLHCTALNDLPMLSKLLKVENVQKLTVKITYWPEGI